MSSKYIICCDFDGVLHSYTSGWKGPTVIPDPPVPGALDWIITITENDRFELAVYSSRSKEQGGVQAMFGWLHTHLVDHFERTHSVDRMNARVMSEKVLERLTFPTQKPAASMTIDDRAFHFQGTFPTIEWLLGFQPWTKVGPNNWRPWIEKKIEDGRLHIRVHEGEEPKVLMLDPTMSATIEAVCVPGLETSVAVRDADQRIADLKRENHHLKLRLEAAEARLSALDPAVD